MNDYNGSKWNLVLWPGDNCSVQFNVTIFDDDDPMELDEETVMAHLTTTQSRVYVSHGFDKSVITIVDDDGKNCRVNCVYNFGYDISNTFAASRLSHLATITKSTLHNLKVKIVPVEHVISCFMAFKACWSVRQNKGQFKRGQFSRDCNSMMTTSWSFL